jgi:intracellular sulfur oxidation DsrE/DsrF family protein
MSEGLKRRGLFAAIAGAAVGLAATRAAKGQGVPRVCYHLSDLEKVGFALGNIENHIEGMGGPGTVEIILVVNGPALSAFHQNKANPDVARRFSSALDKGIEADACGNTMDAQKVALNDLLPGFVRVDQGGVTRLAQLQHEGYAYIRP